ncbi:MAG: DUF3520 domain-containing protein [Defluviicoccus sp.]|nr:DUF3520 domain-containing protein [Defluviicoccus sp.]MDE0277855.1 DUF3520 domain-containing protein [Defluviicoccus sp.]
MQVQVEFNAALIAEYRLIGYETRMLAREDFRNDKVDAGDTRAGHTVTALYEIALAGSGGALTPPLRYGARQERRAGGPENELATVSIRYKKPDADESVKIARHVTRADVHGKVGDAPGDVRFAAAIAAFGQILRGGRYTPKNRKGDCAGALTLRDRMPDATAHPRARPSLWPRPKGSTQR